MNTPYDKDEFSTRVRDRAAELVSCGPDALSGLFDLVADRLVRWATVITRNQHDAEDAVQSVLVKVVSKPTTLIEADSPWAYLLQMVRNDSIAILRRKKRRDFVMSLVDLWTRTKANPADPMESEESAQAIWVALRALPSEQSQVVVLKIWEGMTFEEIAQLLQTPLPTVASRYRYALAKLARQLHPNEYATRRSDHASR
jgi:RNA polymerase sigma-70 factor, ECF subfamily